MRKTLMAGVTAVFLLGGCTTTQVTDFPCPSASHYGPSLSLRPDHRDHSCGRGILGHSGHCHCWWRHRHGGYCYL